MGVDDVKDSLWVGSAHDDFGCVEQGYRRWCIQPQE